MPTVLKNRPVDAPGLWHDSIPGCLDPGPALATDIESDVAIVGAGYTGLWTAYYLKKNNPSLEVSILEAETAGYGASGRNGGWCSGYLSGIEHWLDDPARRDAGIRLQRLMFDTVAEIGRVTREESIDCHFEQSGALEIAVLPQQLERLKTEIENLRRLGFSETDYRWLDAGETGSRLSVDRALGGLLMRHCAAVHPARLARGLSAAVQRLGVSVFEKSPALAVNPGSVRTPNGKVKARNVILATEGYTGSIRDRTRQLIPLHSMMVATEPLNKQQLSEVRFKRRYCFGNLDRLVTYGQLTADNRIAFGCRGSYLFGSGIQSFEPGDPVFNVVRETLLQFFPGLRGVRFSHSWGGCMGVSRTLRPSVVFDRDAGVGWAGGYFGNGVGAAHLAGKTLADLVLGFDTDRVNTPWVNPAGPARRWEPEPLRWLGIRSRARLMQLSDQAEYRGSPLAPVFSKTLDALFP
ncbi:MAG: FAD-dependent oxidoreductase [Xanthomonadales bacterium]|nr:FAD-dependent oxidoreductase [Xanthomonadales bacterium]